jgi:hypothetical protein
MLRPAILLALMIIVGGTLVGCSVVDIDYSHNVAGTGTVITDYRMGHNQNTEASGRVRGTGLVSDKYLFASSNDSENVTLEDQFVFSKAQVPERISLSDYPQSKERPEKFRLVGMAWAEGLNISGKEDREGQNISR